MKSYVGKCKKKQAACIKELEILCAKADTIEFEKDNKKNEEWWTNDDYQAALKLVIQCANVGLAEKVTVLKGHEEGHEGERGRSHGQGEEGR